MYHAIVKRIARKNFLRVNRKGFDAILSACVLASTTSSAEHMRSAVSATIARPWDDGLPASAAFALISR